MLENSARGWVVILLIAAIIGSVDRSLSIVLEDSTTAFTIEISSQMRGFESLQVDRSATPDVGTVANNTN